VCNKIFTQRHKGTVYFADKINRLINLCIAYLTHKKHGTDFCIKCCFTFTSRLSRVPRKAPELLTGKSIHHDETIVVTGFRVPATNGLIRAADEGGQK
jgi:hypothetical protein